MAKKTTDSGWPSWPRHLQKKSFSLSTTDKKRADLKKKNREKERKDGTCRELLRGSYSLNFSFVIIQDDDEARELANLHSLSSPFALSVRLSLQPLVNPSSYPVWLEKRVWTQNVPASLLETNGLAAINRRKTNCNLTMLQWYVLCMLHFKHAVHKCNTVG